jgi:hypothetical protein
MLPQDRKTVKNRCEQELRKLQRDSEDGVLRPKAVVAFAKKNKESALHTQFTWDVGKAAEQYWLEQARRVIRVHVMVEPSIEEEIQVFVALEDDRAGDGGYRLTQNVMSEPQRRAQLLRQALKELKRIREKYKSLAALAKIFSALDDVEGDEEAA